MTFKSDTPYSERKPTLAALRHDTTPRHGDYFGQCGLCGGRLLCLDGLAHPGFDPEKGLVGWDQFARQLERELRIALKDVAQLKQGYANLQREAVSAKQEFKAVAYMFQGKVMFEPGRKPENDALLYVAVSATGQDNPTSTRIVP